jgi:hypothetical protein
LSSVTSLAVSHISRLSQKSQNFRVGGGEVFCIKCMF